MSEEGGYGWREGAARSVGTFVWPTRAHRVYAVALTVLGAALCFVPLFDRIGYESAAAVGVVAGLFAPYLTLRAIDSGTVPGPLSGSHAIAEFGRLAVRHLIPLAAPLVLLAANAARVRVCDVQSGLVFWGLIPVVSVVLGQGLGWVAAGLLPGRGRWRHLAAYGAVLASAFWFGLHLTLEPPIVGHQMLLGYFSGSIYDEALAVPSSLVAYRGMNALWLAAALAGLEVRRAVDRGGAVGWPLVAAVALTVGAAGLWYYRKPLGVGIDRGYVADQLGGRTTTEHFVIHYPQTRRFLRQVERLERDHEFRYREMRAFFETDPADGGRLHSFVYPDRDTKARLMGGRSTMVAKLWLGEIHVLWPRYGHHLLAHELAHLFTEPFGAGPLSLSITNGIGVNMGLVEGVATAADRPPNELTLHEASAAMRRLEMAPDVVDIVGAGGFWTSASGRAYTVAGSFVRFLVDRHGIQALKRAYPRGDFRGAYGEPLSALVESWHASLDSVDLTEAEMDRARYLYRESTIFEKTCARSAAEVRRRARLAAARGEPVEARRLFDRLVAYAPDNLDYRIEAVDQLLKAGDIDGARERIEELLSRDLKPGRRARVIELEGDAAWRAGQLSRARSSYRQARGIGLPSAMQRRIEAKLRALESGEEIRRLAFEYLLARNPATIDVFYPTEWYRREPESALAAYLVGRRLWSARKWRRAVTFLDAARGGLEGTLLAAEVRRLLGRSLYGAGRFDRARAVFSELADHPRSRYAVEAEEWLRRIRWRRRNTERREDG